MLRKNERKIVRRGWVRHRDEMERIRLTEQQARVMRFIDNCREFPRSSDIARRFDFSASHAANVLKALYERGYVGRFSVGQGSGGYEYEWRSLL